MRPLRKHFGKFSHSHGFKILVILTIIVSGYAIGLFVGFQRDFWTQHRELQNRAVKNLLILEKTLRSSYSDQQFDHQKLTTSIDKLLESTDVQGVAILNANREVWLKAGYIPRHTQITNRPLWVPGSLVIQFPLNFDQPIDSGLHFHNLLANHPGRSRHRHNSRRHSHRHEPREHMLPELSYAERLIREDLAPAGEPVWVFCAIDTFTIDEQHRATSKNAMTSLLALGLFQVLIVTSFIFFRKQQRLKSELELARSKQNELEKLNRIAAGLAHETKNPLMIIRGLAQSSQRTADKNPEIVKQSSAIIDEVDRLTREINGFLQLTRPNEVAEVELSIKSICDDLCAILEDEASQLGIVLVNDTPETKIVTDPDMFRKILLNLTLNAIEAGASVIRYRWTQNRSHGQLTVEDDGPGMSAEQLEHCCEAYTTYREGGTGLGLAIVEKLSESLNCEFSLELAKPHGLIAHLKKIKLV